jgi:hypothetical protein
MVLRSGMPSEAAGPVAEPLEGSLRVRRQAGREGRQDTVGALDEDGRQRFHEEQMLAAELCLVPRASIPPTPTRWASIA